MWETTDLYKEILSGEHWKERRIAIGESEYLLDGKIVSVNTSGSIFPEDTPSVGQCVAGEITATIIKPKKEIPRMSRIVPYVRLTNGEKWSEWIQKGVYYIDRQISCGEDNELLEIHGFDAMLFSEADFPSSDDDWPRNDIDVVRDIAKDMGVAVDPRTVAIMDKGYPISYPAQYSQREVLGFLASMYAGSFVMSDKGELRLIQINGIPKETSFLTDSAGFVLTFGGDRINV